MGTLLRSCIIKLITVKFNILTLVVCQTHKSPIESLVDNQSRNIKIESQVDQWTSNSINKSLEY